MSEKLMDKRMWALVAAIIIVTSALISVGVVTQHSDSAPAGKITVTDSLGRTFTFQHPVTRIVSLDPSATAILYALGSYKYLVGGNEYDCYPPHETVPNVGNSYSVNYEEILNLSPQVVLGYGSSMPTYGTYINNTLHIPFLLDNPENFSQIEDLTTMLGILTGAQSNATLINNWMLENLAGIQDQVSLQANRGESVFYYLSACGGIWTSGNETFINQYFTILDLKNIAKNPGYYTVSAELIANESPDIILLDQYVPYSDVTVAPFNETNAMTSSPQKVYTLFNDSFFNEPDFRIVYAIQWLAEQVYPGIQLSISQFPINLQYPPWPSS